MRGEATIYNGGSWFESRMPHFQSCTLLILLGKQWKMHGPALPMEEAPDFSLATAGHGSHLGSEAVDGKSLCFPASFSL